MRLLCLLLQSQSQTKIVNIKMKFTGICCFTILTFCLLLDLLNCLQHDATVAGKDDGFLYTASNTLSSYPSSDTDPDEPLDLSTKAITPKAAEEEGSGQKWKSDVMTPTEEQRRLILMQLMQQQLFAAARNPQLTAATMAALTPAHAKASLNGKFHPISFITFTITYGKSQ